MSAALTFHEGDRQESHQESWSVSTWLCPMSHTLLASAVTSMPQSPQSQAAGEAELWETQERCCQGRVSVAELLYLISAPSLLAADSSGNLFSLCFRNIVLRILVPTSPTCLLCTFGFLLRIPPHPRRKAHFLVGLLRPYKIFLFSSSGMEKISRIKLLDGSANSYNLWILLLFKFLVCGIIIVKYHMIWFH